MNFRIQYNLSAVRKSGLIPCFVLKFDDICIFWYNTRIKPQNDPLKRRKDGTEVNDPLITAALDFAKRVFENDSGGHDFYHTLRVVRLAERLAAAEGADPETVLLAAALHDVDDRKLSPQTNEKKDRAVRFLRGQGVPEEKIRLIREIIGEVSFVGTDSVTPATVEGKCVQDADRLDAIGAIGIARTFAYGGAHSRAMYDPDCPPKENMTAEEYLGSSSPTVNHFYEKLFFLRGMMNTETAREIALGREEFMREFLRRFYDEWDGKQ